MRASTMQLRDNRDVRGPLCGNVVSKDDATYMYVDPRALMRLRDPDLAERLNARLRGEHVDLFPREAA